MWKKFQKWWLFTMRNPVVRKGEASGFKWKFRRFWLDIETVSGNFKARFMAGEHPFGYLVAGETDENVHGYCQMLYMVGMLLTTDQKFVDDVTKAVREYEKRIGQAELKEDGEEAALAEEKKIQELAEMEPKQRRRVERDINGRFKKAVKAVQKEEAEAEHGA